MVSVCNKFLKMHILLQNVHHLVKKQRFAALLLLSTIDIIGSKYSKLYDIIFIHYNRPTAQKRTKTGD